MISAAVRAASWPASEASAGLLALGTHTRLATRADAPEGFEDADEPHALRSEVFERWVPLAAQYLGFEATAAQPASARLRALLTHAGPMLVRFVGEPDGLLAIVRAAGNHIVVVAPDLRLRRLRREDVYEALMEEHVAPLRPQIERILERAAIPERRRAAAVRAVLEERVAVLPVFGLWHLRRTSADSFSRHLRDLRITPALARLSAVYLVRMTLMLGSWAVVGRMALREQLDPGWMFAWALALLSIQPLGLWSSWFATDLASRFNYTLQLQLVAGLLRLPPDATHRIGAGRMLGRWMEASALEALARTGAVQAVFASFDLLIALGILFFVQGAFVGGGLLFAWCALGAVAALGYYRERQNWTALRIHLSADLTRDMVGHRTKRVQQDPRDWVARADGDGALFYDRGRRLDRASRWLQLLPSGWVLTGLAWLASTFALGTEDDTQLVIGIGVIVLGERAIRSLLVALTNGVNAIVAFEQVDQILDASRQLDVSRAPGLASANLRLATGELVAEARDVTFTHPGQTRPVLDRVNLVLEQGDSVLLQGPSGGGKSTLVSLLAGLRRPDGGSILSRGLDRDTLGTDGWRRRVMLVPQFHQNYIFADTLVFNLLAGSRWPTRPQFVAAAREICDELGLGPLIDRMPAGLEQPVGEMGWQLSHGERSRVFIARALLQRPTAIILDESLAALDPETRQLVLDCVRRRVETVVLIAHP